MDHRRAELAYSTEAILWGAFLEQHLSEFPAGQKVKVAALVVNNDFGKLYDASFRAYLAQSPSSRTGSSYTTETIEAVGADDHRPDDHAGGREPRHVHRHDRRHVLHPGRSPRRPRTA